MELLKLSDVKKEFKFHIKFLYSLYLNSFRNFIKNDTRYSLDLDVYLPSKGINLQRGLCWTLFQKQQLIISLCKGLPIPKISVIQNNQITTNGKRGITVFQVIDGKQRLSTIISFIKGEFPIIVNGNDYFISDMEIRLANEILGYSPRGDVAYSYSDSPITDDDKIAWFYQINFSGTQQEEAHMKKLQSL